MEESSVISSFSDDAKRPPGENRDAAKSGTKNDIGAHHNNNRDNFVTITIRRSKMFRGTAESCSENDEAGAPQRSETGGIMRWGKRREGGGRNEPRTMRVRYRTCRWNNFPLIINEKP